MIDPWFALLMGHTMGDYVLQSKDMAILKDATKSPLGTALLWCTIHSLGYTACVCFWLGLAGLSMIDHPLMFVLVLVSHWPIDLLSLAEPWLRLIRGRSLKQAMGDTGQDREFNVAFTAVVYAVTDNWMHLALMALIVLGLQKGMI